MKLRLCRAGEEGSIMSNYFNLGEDQPHEWSIVPLSIYVYGVENGRNALTFDWCRAWDWIVETVSL